MKKDLVRYLPWLSSILKFLFFNYFWDSLDPFVSGKRVYIRPLITNLNRMYHYCSMSPIFPIPPVKVEFLQRIFQVSYRYRILCHHALYLLQHSLLPDMNFHFVNIPWRSTNYYFWQHFFPRISGQITTWRYYLDTPPKKVILCLIVILLFSTSEYNLFLY